MEEENKTIEGAELPEEKAAEEQDLVFEAPAEEKDSTVELRENYEEASVPPEKPKKKMSKKKLIIIIVACVLAAALLGFLLWFFIPSGSGSTPDRLVFDHPSAPKTGTISADVQAKVDAALSSGATDLQKKEAFIALYNLANENKINATQCVMIAQGSGTATVEGLSGGTMDVRAFKVQANGEYYYQKGAKLIDVATGKVEVLEDILDQQERAYCSADKKTCRTVNLKGAKAQVDSTFSTELPFLQLGCRDNKGRLQEKFTQTYTYEGFKAATYVSAGGDEKEINNFNYASANSIREVKEFTHNDKEGYYDITVVVEVTDETTVKAAREYLRVSAKADDLEYKKYELNVKIWDNGYIRSFRDEEIWEGNAIITGNIKRKSTSDTWYEAAFYYDYNSLVKDGFISKSNKDIKSATFAKDIINTYAKEVEWVK